MELSLGKLNIEEQKILEIMTEDTDEVESVARNKCVEVCTYYYTCAILSEVCEDFTPYETIAVDCMSMQKDCLDFLLSKVRV